MKMIAGANAYEGMYPLTQRQILLKVLADRDWTPVYDLTLKSTPYGYLGLASQRRLRELAHEGKIDRMIINKIVHYKLKPDERTGDVGAVCANARNSQPVQQPLSGSLVQ